MKKILLILVLIFTMQLVYSLENYTQLRMDFASQKDFNPYSLQALEKALINDAVVKWKGGEALPAIKKLKELVKIYPYSIEGHKRLSDAYGELRNHTKKPELIEKSKLLEKKHLNITMGIIKSIVKSGDGHSSQTPYKVITISEEYMTLFYFGLKATKQFKQPNTGTKIIDVIDTVNDKGTSRKVYFELVK